MTVEQNNLFTSTHISFPHTVFHLEITDVQYINLNFGAPIYVVFKYKGNILPYGLTAQIQSVERAYSSKVKLQLYSNARVRILHKSDSEYLPVRVPEPRWEFCSTLCIRLIEKINYLVGKLTLTNFPSNNLKDKLNSYTNLFERAMKYNSVSKFLIGFYTLAYMLITEVRVRVMFHSMNLSGQLELLIAQMIRSVETIQIDAKVQESITKKLETQQRNFVLNEKIKALHKELGQKGHGKVFSKRWLSGPDYFIKVVRKELQELETMNRTSPEYAQQKKLLEYMCALPWTSDQGKVSQNVVRDQLEQSHHGMRRAKEAILDYVTAYSINPDNTQILCFCGAPGIGKTTFCRSIAKALKREFFKISLAGCSDSTYLLGSSRVYINSQPGVIIRTMAKARSNSPIILLDEVDKTSQRYSANGSPVEYALLEILDKSNNDSFKDHFIEEGYSLRNVLFVCTANSLDQVPPTLIDRMKVVWLDMYSTEEKLSIAQRYLIPELSRNYRFQEDFIDHEGILHLIENYTQESGVRTLKKRLETLLVRRIRGKYPGLANAGVMNDVFEHRMIRDNLLSGRSKLVQGRSFGMYATSSVGGGIIPIDVSFLGVKEKPSWPKVQVTGQVGKAMIEQVNNAMIVCTRWLKENGREDSILSLSRCETVSVNYGSCGQPKDGPSAGVATTIAMMSQISLKPLPYWAYTGEINPVGEVMSIGGLKEKITGAMRNGLEGIVIPGGNRHQVEIVLKEIGEVTIPIYFIESFDELVQLVWKGQL